MLDDRFYISHGPLTLADLIEGLEARLPDPKFCDELISSAGPLGVAIPEMLTFISSKKGLEDLKTCKATACFVTEELASAVGAEHIIPIISKTPRAHFARAIGRLASEKTLGSSAGEARIAKSASVHSSAVIGASSRIGERVKIGPYVVIGPGVTIGADTYIQSGAAIDCAIIGEGCVIKSGAVIGGRGFGVAHDELGLIDIPHLGRVIIGDRVQIGANNCIDRGQLGDTVLGDDVKLDNLIQIAHNVHLGAGCLIAAQTGISGSCKIGRNVIMGGNVGVADHLTIGDNVRLAARSGVMHNIPEGEVWSGIPAQPIRDHLRLVAITRRLAKKNGSSHDA